MPTSTYNATVKITGFDAGYLKVEWNGQTFTVFLACVADVDKAD
jgi:hypothetical protein